MDGTLTCTQSSPACKYLGTGSFDWTQGTIDGTLSFVSGTKVNLSGSELKDIGSAGVINNAGTFTWSGRVRAQASAARWLVGAAVGVALLSGDVGAGACARGDEPG